MNTIGDCEPGEFPSENGLLPSVARLLDEEKASFLLLPRNSSFSCCDLAIVVLPRSDRCPRELASFNPVWPW